MRSAGKHAPRHGVVRVDRARVAGGGDDQRRHVAAIWIVAAGEAMLGPTVTQRLIETLARLPPSLVAADLPNTLIERERDVLTLVAKGHSNAEIATRLGLSQANVKSRVNRILSKLDLENRVQAAILAHASDQLT